MSPRCVALSERLSPQGRRALAAFIGGRLPAGQLYDELLRARDAADPWPASPQPPGASGGLSLPGH
ncbi:MAG TPA: hypothetical protein VHJ37_09840 [Thermoleophilaceae bacterium]|nr:hypothetical protein [Thermoleophilaceae bacterium]